MSKGGSRHEVVIYTDGACSGNPGPGGWGAIMMSGTHRKEIKGGEAHTTNNRMELMAVISALVQDSVFPAGEMKYLAKKRRFALLVNRFRWEDAEAASREGRGVERVQSVLSIDSVLRVAVQGVPRRMRRVPIRSSSALRRWEMAEGVTCSSAAASSKDPRRWTAARAASWAGSCIRFSNVEAG